MRSFLILFFLQFFSKINKRTPTFIPESRVVKQKWCNFRGHRQGFWSRSITTWTRWGGWVVKKLFFHVRGKKSQRWVRNKQGTLLFYQIEPWKKGLSPVLPSSLSKELRNFHRNPRQQHFFNSCEGCLRYLLIHFYPLGLSLRHILDKVPKWHLALKKFKFHAGVKKWHFGNFSETVPC